MWYIDLWRNIYLKLRNNLIIFAHLLSAEWQLDSLQQQSPILSKLSELDFKSSVNSIKTQIINTLALPMLSKRFISMKDFLVISVVSCQDSWENHLQMPWLFRFLNYSIIPIVQLNGENQLKDKFDQQTLAKWSINILVKIWSSLFFFPLSKYFNWHLALFFNENFYFNYLVFFPSIYLYVNSLTAVISSHQIFFLFANEFQN